jgi:ribosomal protein S12 methylthiotransferase accessory factor
MAASRLNPYARLLPSPKGLLLPGEEGVEVIAVDLDPDDQSKLLELLHQGCELDELVGRTALPADKVKLLIDRLTEVGLLTDSTSRQAVVERGRFFSEISTVVVPNEPRCRILLLGLGQLGLLLLRELLQHEHFEVHIAGPGRVEAWDVSPFYRDDELGYSKTDLVYESLGPLMRSRVRRVSPACLSRLAAEDDLQTALIDVDAAVCCLDQPSEWSARLVHACHARGVGLVVAQLTAEGGFIDPTLASTHADLAHGCPNCAALYRADSNPWEAALPPYLAMRFPGSAPWRYRHDFGRVTVIAQLTVLALRKALDITKNRRPADGKAVRIDVELGRVETLNVPKHYACSFCYPRSEARPTRLNAELEAAVVPLDLDVLADRLPPLIGSPYGLFEPGVQMMTTQYRQAIFGAFRGRGVEPLQNRLANAQRVTSVRRVVRGTQVRFQYGDYLDLDQSRTAEAIAMVEGIERLFTIDYCAPERIVQGTYVELKSNALNPDTLPLYAQEQYAEPGFPLKKYDPSLPLRWIEGVELTDGRSCLVPLDFIHAGTECGIYHATSNGAACHSSLSQAIVNAIYETIERDALMVAWLNRLVLPGVEVTARDPDPYALRDTFDRLGFELAVVDLTLDLEIPVLLGVLRDRRNPDFLLANMVASLNPQRALAKLCRELAQFSYGYLRDRGCFVTTVTQSMNPDDVWAFQDHLAFYQTRDKHRYVDFLTQAPRSRRLSEAARAPTFPDASMELAELKERLAQRGYRVIVVDCTVPMVAQLGLRVVKVVIPGLQPLNAGHRRRVLGGNRLYQVPVELGLAECEKTLAELNPWPHPFW